MSYLRRHWKTISIACAVLLVALIAYLFLPGNAASFNKAYVEYATVARAQDVAAFYPSTESNEIRTELYSVLSRALVGDISNEKRLEFAQKGLALLVQAEKQIDSMADLAPEVAARLEDIRKSDTLFVSQKTRSTIQEVLALGDRRKALIEDIRGLSYKANFYSEDIFKRLVEEGGELTAAHTSFLNEQIPLVEEQFDKRSALYTELQKVSAELDAMMGDFDD